MVIELLEFVFDMKIFKLNIGNFPKVTGWNWINLQ